MVAEAAELASKTVTRMATVGSLTRQKTQDLAGSLLKRQNTRTFAEKFAANSKKASGPKQKRTPAMKLKRFIKRFLRRLCGRNMIVVVSYSAYTGFQLARLASCLHRRDFA